MIDGEDLVGLLVNGSVAAYASSSNFYISKSTSARSIYPDDTNMYELGNTGAQWNNLKSRYVQLERSITLSSTSSPLVDEGTIYFDGTHFYGRAGGAWKQLDN